MYKLVPACVLKFIKLIDKSSTIYKLKLQKKLYEINIKASKNDSE